MAEPTKIVQIALHSFAIPHPRVIAEVGEESLTKQEFADECDIHNILKQYSQTGIITHVQSARPDYLDLPSDMDYQQALNIQLQATEAFANLPSSVRETFQNDPYNLLVALNDEKQHDLLREVGILRPLDPPAAPAVAPQTTVKGAEGAA